MSEFQSLGDLLQQLELKHKVNFNMSWEERNKKKAEWYNEGEGDMHLVDGYNCNICKNKGDIADVNENGYEVHYPCKCQKIRAIIRRAKRSGLGDIITEYTFDKYNDSEEWQKEIKKKAQSFCKDDNAKWFFMGGQVGSGKTMICTAITAHYIKAGCETRYMLWSEESKKLKSLVNDISYQEEIDAYKDVDVLYIDDFLKTRNGEQPTNADINLAFEIVNHRLLNNDKITIISSEKTLDEIMEYDEATMSRIYQKAGNYRINIGKDKSKNYRLRGDEDV